jgi:hypothetical protein
MTYIIVVCIRVLYVPFQATIVVTTSYVVPCMHIPSPVTPVTVNKVDFPFRAEDPGTVHVAL